MQPIPGTEAASSTSVTKKPSLCKASFGAPRLPRPAAIGPQIAGNQKRVVRRPSRYGRAAEGRGRAASDVLRGVGQPGA